MSSEGNRGPGRLLALAASIAALAVVPVAAGCSSGDDSDDSTDTTTTSTQAEGGALEPPKAKEKLSEAAKDLEKAIKSGDCKAINEFNPISRAQALDTPERCDALQAQLGGAKVDKTEEFEASGVIDMKRGKARVAVPMIVDQDGTYRIAAIDNQIGQASSGTKASPKFDEAAREAVQALANRDCDEYLAIASRQIGPATAARGREAACTYARNNRIAPIVEARPSIAPQPLGGNSQFAFYGLPTAAQFTTILMVKQDLPPEQADELEPKPAKYAYVDAFATETPDGAGS